jgi:nucleoside phosphorylase
LRGRRPWERWLADPAGVGLGGFDRPAASTDQLAADPGGRSRQHPPPAASGHRPGWPKVHYGTIGSGDRALRSAQVRDELARRHQLSALEMEGAGVGRSAHLSGRHWFMVRGISDYGDHTHSRTWRNYAALAAAAYVRELLAACEPIGSSSPSRR